jgi:DNA-binding CsgD family transcriptional regulator
MSVTAENAAPSKHQAPTALTQRNLEIVSRWRAGTSRHSLAAEYGVSHQRISQIIHKVHPASRPPLWPAKQTAALKTLLSEGHNSTKIGRRLGVSKNAVVGKLRRLHLGGTLTTQRANAVLRRDLEIVSRYDAGAGLGVLAAECGVSKALVRRVLRQHGRSSPRPTRTRWSAEQTAEAEVLLTEGHSCEEIGRRLSRSGIAIETKLRRLRRHVR